MMIQINHRILKYIRSRCKSIPAAYFLAYEQHCNANTGIIDTRVDKNTSKNVKLNSQITDALFRVRRNYLP